MPRTVVALVSADDFVAAARVYADRVNDMLRRNGIGAEAAVAVSQTAVLELLVALTDEPETVIDLAGWWFARAITLTASDDPDEPMDLTDETRSVLAGTSGEAGVRDAIATLPNSERAAIVLRDGYDLPPQAVGVAMRRRADTAAELTASGRLLMVTAYDGVPMPDLSGHLGNTTVDLVSLSQLAEGSIGGPRAESLRRHIVSCPACEDMLDALAKARRLTSGLPIIALSDDAREAMLAIIEDRAVDSLPSHDAVLQSIEDDREPGPVISPILAIVVLVVGLALGIAVAVSTELRDRHPTPLKPHVTHSASPSAPVTDPSAAASQVP